MEFYKLFNLNKSASFEEIKRAYRSKASKTHPDKGGNEEEFKKLNNAYNILINPEKRKAYDEGKEEFEPKNSELNQLMPMIINRAINECNVKHDDIIDHMKTELQRIKSEIEANIQNQERNEEKFKEVLKRIKRAPEKNDYIKNFALNQIKDIENGIRLGNEKLEAVKEAEELIENYSYKIDQKPEIPQNTASTYSSSNPWIIRF